MAVAALIDFYQGLSPETVRRLPEFYSDDAYFKDPFNEVRGAAAIERIFRHMFDQVAEPRFEVTETVVDGPAAMLAWRFHFRTRLWRRSEAQVIRGVSHVKFTADGKVCFHRDYWDAAEELYSHLPILGPLLRRLQRAFAA